MRTAFTLCFTAFLTVALGACGTPQEPADSTTNLETVVAKDRLGEITLAEADRFILDQTPGQRWTTETDSATRYATAARRLAIDRLLYEEAVLVGADQSPEFQQTERRLLRKVYTDHYIAQHPAFREPIAEDELRAFYDEHREQRFDRDERREVLHIFKRCADAAACDPVIAEMESLRERAQAGESFELLAREHSESETRHDGGRLGLVPRGRFPADFDRVVFALEVGTPSRAVRTADGVHLFLVTHVLEAQSFSFEDVRRVIARELEGQRREKLLERVSRDLPLPENPIVFEREELESRLRTANARTILLQLGDFQLTASQLQAHLVELRRQLGARQEPDLALRLVDEIRHREIIYQHVLREGLPEIAQDMLERERRRQLIEHYSRQKLARFVEAQPERIQQHFERNALRFAAPPRAHIRRLEVPLQRGAPGLMARLEEARLELDDGLLTLEQLASELDGTLQDLGLVTAAQLQTVDRRATRFAFQLEAGEHSPPYQVGQTLVLFQVAERHEPVPRPLSAVRDQVISDYLGQNASTIFGEVTETLLAEAEFELFHDRLTDVGPLVPAGS